MITLLPHPLTRQTLTAKNPTSCPLPPSQPPFSTALFHLSHRPPHTPIGRDVSQFVLTMLMRIQQVMKVKTPCFHGLCSHCQTEFGKEATQRSIGNGVTVCIRTEGNGKQAFSFDRKSLRRRIKKQRRSERFRTQTSPNQCIDHTTHHPSLTHTTHTTTHHNTHTHKRQYETHTQNTQKWGGTQHTST